MTCLEIIINQDSRMIKCPSLFLLLLHFFQSCLANCTPSSCGIIRGIESPFRLKDDPKNCGYREFELACENNVTSIYLDSHKYYVKAVNYGLFCNSSIRLVDASIQNDICSFPSYSANVNTFIYQHQLQNFLIPSDDAVSPINFMSCSNPLKNSSIFTEITGCAFNGRYAYIKVGHMNASEVTETCSVDMIVMTSWKFKDLNNLSLSEIHHSLLYGFELITMCISRSGSPPAITVWGDNFMYFIQELLPILLLIIGFLCAAIVSPLVAAIIGLIFVAGFLYRPVGLFLTVLPTAASTPVQTATELVIGSITLAPRIFVFPFALWLLIYKFRRRHLSSYDTIESFLQSDNRLTPIRYSYSDIKKMTRGFQDKLGEGGYGSVYKGKLRSGHHVAVKILGKSGGNSQDFINEIATIGRIHHVNVVKLVGYCAQGSKRALVFDFMPNGSLEKYIFNREKLNSLNWDTKFQIVVGVARGIKYLHQGCDVQILHFDIKPHNILLDDMFVAKISDFGLAKIFSTEKNTVTLTAVRGTIGYVAPELINRSIGAVSYKADVYSFGMLLIEMVSLKRDLLGNNNDSSKYFPCWIYDCLNQGNDIEIEIVDKDDDNDSTRRLVRKITLVALWCIQMNPNDRPSMSKVLEMLEGDGDRLQIPDYPSQSTQIAANVDQTRTTWSTTTSISLLHHNDSSPNVEITVHT